MTVNRRRVGLVKSFRAAYTVSDATPAPTVDTALFSTIAVGLWWFVVGVPTADDDDSSSEEPTR